MTSESRALALFIALGIVLAGVAVGVTRLQEEPNPVAALRARRRPSLMITSGRTASDAQISGARRWANPLTSYDHCCHVPGAPSFCLAN